MAATIFWRKDDPNESIVKEVNVPGDFPNPSRKLNRKAVHVESKPWLQKAEVGSQQPRKNVRPPGQTRPKLTQDPTDFGKSGPKKEINLQDKESFRHEDRKIMSASLKDLSNEDKKRITNLIKELAKAGEEKKVAIGALHKERVDFEDKESQLRSNQEKVIMERDQLRETLLEYQFLINQYSKQLQDEKDAQINGFPLKKHSQKESTPLVSPQHRRDPSVKEVQSPMSAGKLESMDNLRPNMKMYNEPQTSANIPTYYAVSNTDTGSSQQMHAESKETVTKIYSGAGIDFPDDINGGSRNSIGRQHKNDISNINLEIQNDMPIKSSSYQQQENDNYANKNYIDNTVGKKDDFVQNSSNKETLRMQSEGQNALIQQQKKLLEQQIEIQQQIKNLQIIQRSSTTELLRVLKPVDKKASCDTKEIQTENTQFQKMQAPKISKQNRSPLHQSGFENSLMHEDSSKQRRMQEESLQQSEASYVAEKGDRYLTTANQERLSLNHSQSQGMQKDQQLYVGQPQQDSIMQKRFDDSLRRENSFLQRNTKRINYFQTEKQNYLRHKDRSQDSLAHPRTKHGNHTMPSSLNSSSNVTFDDRNTRTFSTLPKQHLKRGILKPSDPNIANTSSQSLHASHKSTSPRSSRTAQQLSLLELIDDDDDDDDDDGNSETCVNAITSDYGSYLQFERRGADSASRYEATMVDYSDSETEDQNSTEQESEVFADIFYMQKF